MKIRLIALALLVLLVLPTFCFAKESSSPSLLFDYVFARTMAVNYVLDLKEKYANDLTDEDYIIAKIKYQKAAAKFTGLKAIYDLDIINRINISNNDDPKYTTAGKSALRAYSEFEAAAEHALSKKLTPSRNKSLTVAEAISIINTLKELYVKYENAQNTKFDNLSLWLNTYYVWPDWYAIGQEKVVSSPEPDNPDKPKPKPNN